MNKSQMVVYKSCDDEGTAGYCRATVLSGPTDSWYRVKHSEDGSTTTIREEDIAAGQAANMHYTKARGWFVDATVKLLSVQEHAAAAKKRKRDERCVNFSKRVKAIQRKTRRDMAKRSLAEAETEENDSIISSNTAS